MALLPIRLVGFRRIAFHLIAFAATLLPKDTFSNFETYVMSVDGSGQKRLTHNSSFYESPSWSPDGKKTAFLSLRDGNLEIHTMNVHGSEQRNLMTDPAKYTRPSWSPLLPLENNGNEK